MRGKALHMRKLKSGGIRIWQIMVSGMPVRECQGLYLAGNVLRDGTAGRSRQAEKLCR